MTREEVEKIVAEARERGGIPDLLGMDLSRMDLAGVDLSYATLSGANLSWANLTGANLRRANLYKVNLRGADLYGANLYRADLAEADLSEADLREAILNDAELIWADLRGAKLRGANLNGIPQILRVDNLPSGQATLVPTPRGWHLTVGCWRGTVDGLRELIASDFWPEAEGAERERRRPYLELLISMCEVHMRYWTGIIEGFIEIRSK